MVGLANLVGDQRRAFGKQVNIQIRYQRRFGAGGRSANHMRDRRGLGPLPPGASKFHETFSEKISQLIAISSEVWIEQAALQCLNFNGRGHCRPTQTIG